MGNARRNNNDIALGNLAGFATADVLPADLVRRSRLWLHNTATGHECRSAIEDMNEDRVLQVQFRHAGLLAAAGVDHVILALAVKQHSALVERARDSRSREVRDRSRRRFLLDAFGAGDSQFFILCRGRSATHAYGAHDRAVHRDRYSALQRSEIVEGDHRYSPILHDVLEELGRLLERSEEHTPE